MGRGQPSGRFCRAKLQNVEQFSRFPLPFSLLSDSGQNDVLGVNLALFSQISSTQTRFCRFRHGTSSEIMFSF